MVRIDWDSEEVQEMLRKSAKFQDKLDYIDNKIQELMYALGYDLDSGDDWSKGEPLTDSELYIQFDSDYNIDDYFISPGRIFDMDGIAKLERAFVELERDVHIIKREIEKIKEEAEKEIEKCQN